MRTKSILVSAMLTAIILPDMAIAEVIRYNFNSKISGIVTGGAAPPSAIQVGDVATGWLDYDNSAVKVSSVLNSTSYRNIFPNARLVIGTYVWQFDSIGAASLTTSSFGDNISVSGGLYDEISLNTPIVSSPLPFTFGQATEYASINISKLTTDLSMNSSQMLPSALDFGQYSPFSFQLSQSELRSTPIRGFSIFLSDYTFTPAVPEAPTYALLIGGGVVLFWRRRRATIKGRTTIAEMRALLQ